MNTLVSAIAKGSLNSMFFDLRLRLCIYMAYAAHPSCPSVADSLDGIALCFDYYRPHKNLSQAFILIFLTIARILLFLHGTILT